MSPKRFFWTTLLLFLLSGAVRAQTKSPGDLEKKRLPDTTLGHRTLFLPGPFNPSRALRRLFPGKYYDLGTCCGSPRPNRLINWYCPTCKPRDLPTADMDDSASFPDGAIATRPIGVFSYIDSNGRPNRVISFEHSGYDPDGLQVGRFFGGILGMARFIRVDSGWRLTVFQPAIGAYGAFSSCPPAEPLLIGEHQYGFMIEHGNGAPGEPYYYVDYLVAEMGNSYRQILHSSAVGRSNVGPGLCSWTSTYKALPSEKTRFRDIAIVCKGEYFAADKEGLPDELQGKLKGRPHGHFTITHVYTYSAKKKEYIERLPAKVSIQKKIARGRSLSGHRLPIMASRTGDHQTGVPQPRPVHLKIPGIEL